MNFDVKIATVEQIVECCSTAVDDSVRNLPGNWKAWAERKIATGPSYAIFYDGSLVCCAGLSLVRQGVANAWAVLSSLAPRLRAGVPTAESLTYVWDAVWTFRNMIEILQERFDLKAIRTFSVKGFGQSQKLLNAIGFKKMRRESQTRYFYRWA